MKPKDWKTHTPFEPGIYWARDSNGNEKRMCVRNNAGTIVAAPYESMSNPEEYRLAHCYGYRWAAE